MTPNYQAASKWLNKADLDKLAGSFRNDTDREFFPDSKLMPQTSQSSPKMREKQKRIEAAYNLPKQNSILSQKTLKILKNQSPPSQTAHKIREAQDKKRAMQTRLNFLERQKQKVDRYVNILNKQTQKQDEIRIKKFQDL